MEGIIPYKVTECPPTAYYVPNFISKQEEKYLLDQVYRSPKTKWTVLSNRKLQNWGGVPQAKGMIQEPLPKWLEECCSKVNATGVFDLCAPNHVLINEYKPGQGIMPHLDGPLYYPTVSTISIGSHTVINFYATDKDESTQSAINAKTPTYKLYLEPRSLLILKDDMYQSYMHGIDEIFQDNLSLGSVANFPLLADREMSSSVSDGDVVRDRGTRVSLTIRHVPNARKLKLQIGKLFR